MWEKCFRTATVQTVEFPKPLHSWSGSGDSQGYKALFSLTNFGIVSFVADFNNGIEPGSIAKSS